MPAATQTARVGVYIVPPQMWYGDPQAQVALEQISDTLHRVGLLESKYAWPELDGSRVQIHVYVKRSLRTDFQSCALACGLRALCASGRYSLQLELVEEKAVHGRTQAQEMGAMQVSMARTAQLHEDEQELDHGGAVAAPIYGQRAHRARLHFVVLAFDPEAELSVRLQPFLDPDAYGYGAPNSVPWVWMLSPVSLGFNRPEAGGHWAASSSDERYARIRRRWQMAPPELGGRLRRTRPFVEIPVDLPHTADVVPPPRGPSAPPAPRHRPPPGAPQLPIARHLDRIMDTVNSAQVVVVTGRTGCGKSTQVPRALLAHAAAEGAPIHVLVAQPRRHAARSLCDRVRMEEGAVRGVRAVDVAADIGYHIGQDCRADIAVSKLVFCTTGILLNLLRGNQLGNATHVVIDEVHERTVECDVAMAVLALQLRQYAQKKLLLMSATVDVAPLLRYWRAQGYHAVHVDTDDVERSDGAPGYQVRYLDEVHSRGALGSIAEAYIAAGRAALAERFPQQPEQAPDASNALELERTEVGARRALEREWAQGACSAVRCANQQDAAAVVSRVLRDCGAAAVLERLSGTTAAAMLALPHLCELLDRVRIRARGAWGLLSFHGFVRVAAAVCAEAFPHEERIAALADHLVRVCDEAPPEQSIMVFLAGIGQQQEVERRLLAAGKQAHVQLHVLHSSIPLAAQQCVHEDADKQQHRLRAGKRKVVLATNVAESSITISDVDVVIDSCLGRESERGALGPAVRTRVISADSAAQRAGRTGRCRDGRVDRMIFRVEALAQQRSRQPEIQRKSTDQVLLRLLSAAGSSDGLDVGEVIDSLMDPPCGVRREGGGARSDPAVAEAFMRLERQHCVECHYGGGGSGDSNGEDAPAPSSGAGPASCPSGHEVVNWSLSPLGRIVQRMPLQLPLSTVCVLGALYGCPVAAAQAAAVAARGVARIPGRERAQGRFMLALSDCTMSDPVAYCHLFRLFVRMRQTEGSVAAQRRWCAEHFVDHRNMEEVVELAQETLSVLRRFGITHPAARAGSELERLSYDDARLLCVVWAGGCIDKAFEFSPDVAADTELLPPGMPVCEIPGHDKVDPTCCAVFTCELSGCSGGSAVPEQVRRLASTAGDVRGIRSLPWDGDCWVTAPPSARFGESPAAAHFLVYYAADEGEPRVWGDIPLAVYIAERLGRRSEAGVTLLGVTAVARCRSGAHWGEYRDVGRGREMKPLRLVVDGVARPLLLTMPRNEPPELAAADSRRSLAVTLGVPACRARYYRAGAQAATEHAEHAVILPPSQPGLAALVQLLFRSETADLSMPDSWRSRTDETQRSTYACGGVARIARNLEQYPGELDDEISEVWEAARMVPLVDAEPGSDDEVGVPHRRRRRRLHRDAPAVGACAKRVLSAVDRLAGCRRGERPGYGEAGCRWEPDPRLSELLPEAQTTTATGPAKPTPLRRLTPLECDAKEADAAAPPDASGGGAEAAEAALSYWQCTQCGQIRTGPPGSACSVCGPGRTAGAVFCRSCRIAYHHPGFRVVPPAPAEESPRRRLPLSLQGAGDGSAGAPASEGEGDSASSSAYSGWGDDGDAASGQHGAEAKREDEAMTRPRGAPGTYCPVCWEQLEALGADGSRPLMSRAQLDKLAAGWEVRRRTITFFPGHREADGIVFSPPGLPQFGAVPTVVQVGRLATACGWCQANEGCYALDKHTGGKDSEWRWEPCPLALRPRQVTAWAAAGIRPGADLLAVAMESDFSLQKADDDGVQKMQGVRCTSAFPGFAACHALQWAASVQQSRTARRHMAAVPVSADFLEHPETGLARGAGVGGKGKGKGKGKGRGKGRGRAPPAGGAARRVPLSGRGAAAP